jgi:hypothetical protein
MTLDAHTQGFIDALKRIDKRKGRMNDEVEMLSEEEVARIKGSKTENFYELNQTVYTLEELQTCYDTADLIAMFGQLLEEGYSGLGLGLIIDLIKERCEEV